MAQVTVKLTLEEAKLAKSVLQEAKDTAGQILANRDLRNEYTARGTEGRNEWNDLQRRYSALESIVREFV